MNPQLLIDAIVRQTTVLLARLSTVEGVRSPLGHIANEVFRGLQDPEYGGTNHGWPRFAAQMTWDIFGAY